MIELSVSNSTLRCCVQPALKRGDVSRINVPGWQAHCRPKPRLPHCLIASLYNILYLYYCINIPIYHTNISHHIENIAKRTCRNAFPRSSTRECARSKPGRCLCTCTY